MSNILATLALCLNTHAGVPDEGVTVIPADHFHQAQSFGIPPSKMTADEFLEKYGSRITTLFQTDGSISSATAELMSQIDRRIKDPNQKEIFAILQQDIMDRLNAPFGEGGGLDLIADMSTRADMHKQNLNNLQTFMRTNGLDTRTTMTLNNQMSGFKNSASRLKAIMDRHELLKDARLERPNSDRAPKLRRA